MMLADNSTPLKGHFLPAQLQPFAIGRDRFVALPTQKVSHTLATLTSMSRLTPPHISTYLPSRRTRLYS